MGWRVQVAGWTMLACAIGVCLGQAPAAPAKGGDETCIPGMKDASGKVCPADGVAKKPMVKEQFPYPGSADAGSPDAGAPDAGSQNPDTGGSKQSKDPAQPKGGVPDAPDVPDAPGASAAKAFPYPGADPGDSTAGAAKGGDANGKGSSGSGESSSNDAGGDTADKPKLEDKGSTGKKTRRAPAEKVQTDEQREAEDIKVAKYYRDDGNFEAAYLRAKDAVKVQPDDSEAHFLLAELAQRLKKRDEAVAEFQAYMQLDPDGLEIKKVKKALQDLK